MTTADVASYFGVTRQRVGQIQRMDPSFPRRQIELDGGPIWVRAGMEIWAAAHRPSAVQDASVFLPHGAALLRTAEGIAVAMGHHYIGSSTLWLAILSEDERVRDVFVSIGATHAIVRRAVARAEPPRELPPNGASMNPRAQELLGRAAAAARERGSKVMEPLDLAIAMVDADESDTDGLGRRDLVLAVLESRGAAVDELRRRLAAVQVDAEAVGSFERRRLKRKPRRVDPRRRLLGVLAPNGLGHDPWSRQPWGTAFAHRKDDRPLRVDGVQWFFIIDRDGFFVRTADGRPVGYRWRVLPTPSPAPVNGSIEVLPMPPDDVGYWPEYRYPRD